MKRILCVLLLACCSIARAQVYQDSIRVDMPDRVVFYFGCWVVVNDPDYFGTYCYDQYIQLGGKPTAQPATGLPSDLVVFSFDGSFGLIDKSGDCVFINATPTDDTTIGYEYRCGDFVYTSGFE